MQLPQRVSCNLSLGLRIGPELRGNSQLTRLTPPTRRKSKRRRNFAFLLCRGLLNPQEDSLCPCFGVVYWTGTAPGKVSHEVDAIYHGTKAKGPHTFGSSTARPDSRDFSAQNAWSEKPVRFGPGWTDTTPSSWIHRRWTCGTWSCTSFHERTHPRNYECL